ncbi:glycosyltransferase family 2 protein [Pseudocolwellia agarivorans]|uniref:glycosyltransferase family 2 protein n=1 Tax=Pseudocolwellia agarivorans TaxID=1911682 RepID=UPI003F881789
MYKENRVSVIIPALNEEEAISVVINKLIALTVDAIKVIDHIVVCDNGSIDNTAQIARDLGATVVSQNSPGYGIACLTAMSVLPSCDIVLFVDGDDSCFAEQALPLLSAIVEGNDLAIGSRTLGNIELGALTKPQVFGNWLASYLITLFWQQKITDLGPFRAIRFTSLDMLNMENKTFGWTVEMQVKAIILGMKVIEKPVDSKVRIGESKISGTISGSIKAGIGILSMIAKLYFTQSYLRAPVLKVNNKSGYE